MRTTPRILGHVLGPDFFDRKSLAVARDLIGKYIVRRLDWNGKKVAGRITEVEAYVGARDLASHASKGRTARTEIMFGKPGTLYVYFVYGMHWMLNVVTEKEGCPAAVLIRGVETARGRPVAGPGRVTKMFGIDKSMNGKTAGKKTGLWFEDRYEKSAGEIGDHLKIKRTPRIGVAYAGAIWAKKNYRFVLQNRFVLQKEKRRI